MSSRKAPCRTRSLSSCSQSPRSDLTIIPITSPTTPSRIRQIQSTSPPSHVLFSDSSSSSASIDLESGTTTKRTRFQYEPKNFSSRLLVGFGVKQKLETSQIVSIPFRIVYKYLLVLLLALIAAFLTPQLLPSWIGFKWASPQDLCQNPDHKLESLRKRMRNLTKIDEADLFLRQQEMDLECMNRSAAEFYNGLEKYPYRFLWPDECTSMNAEVSLTETTCVSQNVNVCSTTGGFKKFLLQVSGSCQHKAGPDLCVETTNVNRAQALIELEHNRKVLENSNNTMMTSEPIVATANSKVKEIISNLMVQVDLAGDAYILYSLVSVIVGVPLVVYKREKGSRVLGAMFGLKKMSFILIVVVGLIVYDSAKVVWTESDIDRVIGNFFNDPCYVDPGFSNERVKLIVEACNNVSAIDQQSDFLLQKMDGVFYDTRLFGFCQDDIRKKEVHPKLNELDQLRQAYRLPNISSPGVCNATKLNEDTSMAPRQVSKLRMFLGSGVIAQLLMKFIVTCFVVHLFAYLEPLVLHNGKVEMWGTKIAEINEEERLAVTNFARDKHLLPLMLFSFLMIVEGVLISFAIYTGINGGNQLEVLPAPLPGIINSSNLNLTCPAQIMPY